MGKSRARISLKSEQSPEPVPTHGGWASFTYWTLSIKGVVIAKETERHSWVTDRKKYTLIEHCPGSMKALFDELCGAFDPLEEEQPNPPKQENTNDA